MDIIAGDSIEVEVERILPGGLGLAHAHGGTVFVALAAPGDLLKVRIDRVRGKTAFASVVEVLAPSPVRVEPPCPYFGRCGGCDFQQLSYEAQLQAKAEIIRDCLHRIARLQALPEILVVASPQEWRYRARTNWQVDPGKRTVGYFERGTHRVCDVADCAVLLPELEQVLERIRAALGTGQAIDFTEIEAVAGDEGVSVEPAVAGFQTHDVVRRIGNENYQFSAKAFFQINHALLQSLVSAAIGDISGETAVDLYCGVGLFTLPLARRFSQVTAVESSALACRYARRNLSNADLANALVVNEKVVAWMRQSARTIKARDFVLLDPPRTGAEPEVVQGILALQPRRIAYVSCDPATLARDLKDLLAGDYSLESIAAFDMFPQTHHVETVVCLLRLDAF